MSTPKFDSSYKASKAFMAKLFESLDGPFEPVVNLEQQEEELRYLREHTDNKRFYTITDLPTYEFTHVYGVEKWLGYTNHHFTHRVYIDKVMHPATRVGIVLLSQSIFQILCTGTYPLHFMVQRYSNLMILRHACGEYLLASRIASVFQFDTKNRLLQYLNEYTIIGPYNGQPVNTMPSGFTIHGDINIDMEITMKKRTLERFLRMSVFSKTELQMGRFLAYENKMTRKNLTEIFKMTTNSVDTITGRFLDKTRNFFNLTSEQLPTASAAALFLRNENLL